ncbi:hypothetical protein DSCW_18610 [Desulfosarcina widdelii]|uniref:DUF7424 domain-containing protein n=1 Tax=Desulfosarcina widdelii TaxID=947919 RepID=A0A5K7Z7J0_9BACT|nr:hypothetical protein [Desulfosarcina widdelii]BBO74444.1 hypothetical protein DSCW_18610 [Desulfosarcina widdelii]
MQFYSIENKNDIGISIKTISIVSVFILLFLGCETIVETEVSLQDLLNSKTKIISGDLYVEVAACASHEDSRKPSNAAVQAQQTIPIIFEGAEYIECFSKSFDSFAHFKIPIVIDKDIDGKFASNKNVNIISNKNNLLWIGIPPGIKKKMENFKEESFGATSFDLKVNVMINNDTGKDHPFKVVSAYIDGHPYVYGDLTSHKNSKFLVTLSDVSVDQALKDGRALVLLH